MTHYLKRTVTLTDSLDVTPKGLGYNYWLASHHSLTTVGADGIVHSASYTFHVHPFIKATAQHAEALGVYVGQSIAGIRWVDHKDDESADPQLRQAAVSFDQHLARLEAEAEAVEADRTAAAGEYIVTDRTPPGYGPAEADTRDDEELEAAGDILADVVDRSPGVKVRCKSCDARFDTHAEFEDHSCDDHGDGEQGDAQRRVDWCPHGN